MSRVTTVFFALATAWFAAAPHGADAADKPASEKAKIEALIKHVERLKGAKFIRNGTEYDADTAARFLRGKWEARGGRIKTAREFIEKLASSSSTTGRAYEIKLADGTKKKSGEYLLEQLKKLEKAPDKKDKP